MTKIVQYFPIERRVGYIMSIDKSPEEERNIKDFIHYINISDEYRNSIVMFIDIDSNSISDIKNLCMKTLGQIKE